MDLSYWEIKTWLNNIDFAIVGSGIVGLSCALHLKRKFPKAKVLVLERGQLPQGASTKNAGFACFGSLSEIIDDLNNQKEEDVLDLIQKRIGGLQLLRKTLGDNAIDYKVWGGYEVFLNSDQDLYGHCLENRNKINKLLFPIFNKNVFSLGGNKFGFKNIIPNYIFNEFEGQIDTGAMMESLLFKVQQAGVKILNNCTVNYFTENQLTVKLTTNNFELTTSHLFIATNGFAKELMELPLKPARAQVLITKPIENLPIKGTFHLDRGYYYFRNIDNRILFGGGRNLDFSAEETTEFGQTKRVQDHLEQLLKTTILPEHSFEIEHRWSGIMGVGNQKSPIVKSIGNRVYCGVRLGGMGVAIGSLVGKELADFIS